MNIKNQPAKKILSVPDGYICDYADRSFRPDTPEEYVRQILEKRLVNELGYPREQIGVEETIRIGSQKKRVDLAVFLKDKGRSQSDINIIIECKSETIKPSDRKKGVEQLKSYMSACPNCEWGLWTNGIHRETWRRRVIDGHHEFVEFNDIPAADGDIAEIDRPRRERLKLASDDNLLLAFRHCHNYIYATDGLKKDESFFELLKLIFCKTFDEQNIQHPLEFYARSNELASLDGQMAVKKRIDGIFEKVKKRYVMIFAKNDQIELKPESLARAVSVLQPYSFLDTHIDIKGKAYEEVVGSNLRGDRGEFFTPRNIVKMAVRMIAPTPLESVCDPACGTGGFLVMAMKRVIEQIETSAEEEFNRPKKQWKTEEHSKLRDEIRRVAGENFFGFDISETLVKASRMNMVMNNDGSGNIYQNNSLLPPHRWGDQLKENLARALHIEKKDIRNEKTIEFFDVIFTNPPFGSKIPIEDQHTLGQYALGYIWKNEQQETHSDDGWETTEKLQKSAPPEQLFVERCLQFLKPGGRMAIVLPDSILGNPGLSYMRQWLLSKTRIIASIDLHADTFQPRNGTQTSILILQKKTKEEIQEEESLGVIHPYNIFMAVVEKIGHDKRGNTIYARDEKGREIWIDDEDSETDEHEELIMQKQVKKRVIDDQTEEVVKIFTAWKKREGITW